MCSDHWRSAERRDFLSASSTAEKLRELDVSEGEIDRVFNAIGRKASLDECLEWFNNASARSLSTGPFHPAPTTALSLVQAGRTALKPPFSIDSEEEDVKQALKASLVDIKTNKEERERGAIDEDELQQQAAILSCLMESNVDRSDPHKRARAEGTPVGLENSSVHCFFNSLIQCYFHLSPVLSTILSMPPERPPSSVHYLPSSSASEPTQLPLSQDTNHIPSAIPYLASEGPSSTSSATAAISVLNTSCVSASLPAPLSLSSPSSAMAFVYELQSLFSGLHLSHRKYLDPRPALLKLFAALSLSNKEQSMQHDAAEWHDLIIAIIQVAYTELLSLSDLDNNAKVTEFKQLFFSDCVQQLIAKDPQAGQQFHLTSTITVGPMILDIVSGSLLEALEVYTSSVVHDYRLPSNEIVDAERQVHFTSLPRVLCFQLQRVGYDAKEGKAIKSNHKFEIPERIFMNRFLHENSALTKERRLLIDEWRHQLSELKQKRESWEDFEKSHVAVHDALHVSSMYLLKHTTDYINLAHVLESLSKQCLNSLEQCCTQIDYLQRRITHAFDDLNSPENEYVLFAAMIHDGKDAGSGHYFILLRDCASNGFFKLNDASVSRVELEEVKREAEGGDASANTASAYFLVFVRAEDIRTPTCVDSLIRDDLREIWRADNAKFAEEKRVYDEGKIQKHTQQEADRITKNLEIELKEFEQQLKLDNDQNQIVLYSFAMWLYTIPAYKSLVTSVLLEEALTLKLKEVDAVILRRLVQQKISKSFKIEMIQMSTIQQNVVDELRSYYEPFCRVFVDLTRSALDACDRKQPNISLLSCIRACSHLDTMLLKRDEFIRARAALAFSLSFYLSLILATTRYCFLCDEKPFLSSPAKQRTMKWLEAACLASSILSCIMGNNAISHFQKDVRDFMAQNVSEIPHQKDALHSLLLVPECDHARVEQLLVDGTNHSFYTSVTQQWQGKTLLTEYNVSQGKLRSQFPLHVASAKQMLCTSLLERNEEELLEIMCFSDTLSVNTDITMPNASLSIANVDELPLTNREPSAACNGGDSVMEACEDNTNKSEAYEHGTQGVDVPGNITTNSLETDIGETRTKENEANKAQTRG